MFELGDRGRPVGHLRDEADAELVDAGFGDVQDPEASKYLSRLKLIKIRRLASTERQSSHHHVLLGRLLRGLAGLGCLAGIPFVPSFECAWLGVSGLVVTALTFIVAAIRANPGCEITALPHLVLPPRLES